MTHDISRAELFVLFMMLDMPELIKERFAEVGIMNLVMPLLEDDEKRYLFNEAAFSCVPDRDYMDMHSNLRRFCKWYWIRFHKMQRSKYDSEIDVMKTGYCERFSMPCYREKCHHHSLEDAAKYFAEQFISAWERFATK